MTGYSSEAFLEDAALWDRLVHEDDLGRMTQAWDQARAAGTPFRCEYRVITRDEREIWVRDEATFVLDEAGNPLYAQGVMLDVTEQRRNAELLDKEREFVSVLLDAADCMIVVVDSCDGIVRFNETAERLTGYGPPHAIGKSFFTLLPAQEIPAAVEEMAAARSGTSAGRHEGLWLMRGGGVRRVVWSITALPHAESDAHLVVTGIDITAQRSLETQLGHAQKMEAVARLTEGLTHDFNNTLSVIQNYSSFLAANPSLDEAAREDVAEIEKSARNSAGLARQLLVFSRRERVKNEILDVDDIVVGLERLLRGVIGEDIDLIIRPGGNLLPVAGDPGHVEQVIANLAVNARDAMPHGGRLVIETANDRANGSDSPSHVRITVADSGAGIGAEDKGKIFEALYTTKPDGEGTGLGLAVAGRLVDDAGGHVEIESPPGLGASFHVYFPVAGQEAVPHNQPSHSHQGGGRRVVVVEDEPAVRRLVARILTENGFQVIEADQETALGHYSGSDTPDLVVTDVVMPEISGRTLVERIRKVCPDARALYMSGYTDEVMARHGILDADDFLLEKPFSAEELLNAVRQVLEE